MKEYRFPLPNHIEKNMWSTITFVLYVYMFFGGHARRDTFIERMVTVGWSKRNATRLWDDGSRIYKDHIGLHPYISFTHTDYVSIKSHHQWSKINVIINDEDLSKISTVSDMKRFIIWLEAARPKVTETINKDTNTKEFKELFCRTYKSISLNGLAKKFYISGKQAMSVIMKQAMEQFGGDKTSRYVVHQGHMARISNIYNTGKIYRANKRSRLFNKQDNSTPVIFRSEDGKSSEGHHVKGGCKTYSNVLLDTNVWKRNSIDAKMPWLPSEQYENCYNNMFHMF